MKQHREPASQISDAKRELIRADISSGRDETWPYLLFSTTHTSLLLAIVGDLIDPNHYARLELCSRGRDANGVWCGGTRARAALLGQLSTTANAAVACDHVLATAADIAKRYLGIDYLDAPNSDNFYVHDLAVWQIKEALAAAFAAGQVAAR